MELNDIEDEAYYEIKFLGLRILGKDLKRSWVPKAISLEIERLKGEFESERRFFLNQGGIPVLKSRSAAPEYFIYSNFYGLRELLQELGFPENPSYIYFSTLLPHSTFRVSQEQSSYKFDKYSMEVFGLLIKSPEITDYDLRSLIVADSLLYKQRPKYYWSSSGLIVQIWRLRVFNRPVRSIRISTSTPLVDSIPLAIYLEEQWHPIRGRTVTLRGLEYQTGFQGTETVQFIEGALNFIGRVKKRGRPRNTSMYTDRESFLLALTAAYQQLTDSSAYKPVQKEIAKELAISLSTLKSYLRRFEVKWPPSLVTNL